MEPGVVITEFCGAWSTMDVDRITSYFTDDAVYDNVPLQAVEGKANITGAIRAFMDRCSGIRFEIKRQLIDGAVVMNERVDTFVIERTEITVPAAGVFELRDGKIAVWRDYFDVRQAAGLLS